MTSRPTTTPPVREPLLTRTFVALAGADLAYFTAAGVAVFALPVQATEALGATEAGAGLAFGAFAVTALVLRPVVGRLSDTAGRLPMLAGGAALATLGLAATAYVGSLAGLVALRLLLGVAEAMFFVASLAAVADLAPASRLGEALSYNSVGLYLGLTIGPPLGELLVAMGGFRAAWLAAAGLCAVALAVVWALVGETRGPRSTAGRARLIHVPAIAPGVGFLAPLAAMGAFLAFGGMQAERSGLAVPSLALAAYGATVVLGRVICAKYVDRFPPLPLAAAALAIITIGLLAIALFSTAAGVLVGAVVIASGVVFSTPAFFSAIFATAGPGQRGVAAATASVALDLGLAGGPMVAGLVAASRGIPSAFAATAGVAFAGMLWTLLLARRRLSRARATA